MSRKAHRTVPNAEFAEQCRSAFRSGTWSELPHNWQARLTSKECYSIFRTKARCMIAIAKRRENLPRNWDKGLTESEKELCFKFRGFYSDGRVRENAQIGNGVKPNSGKRKVRHTDRFYELLREIEKGSCFIRINGVHRFERKILNDQIEQRHHERRPNNLNSCHSIESVFALASSRCVHKRYRKQARKFLMDKKIVSINSCVRWENNYNYFYRTYTRFPVYYGPDWHEYCSRQIRRGKYYFREQRKNDIRHQIICRACIAHNYFTALNALLRSISITDSAGRWAYVNRTTVEFLKGVRDAIVSGTSISSYQIDKEMSKIAFMTMDLENYRRRKISRSTFKNNNTSTENARQLRALGFVA